MENIWHFHFKEMDRKRAVDWSSCFLEEASGDSDQLDFDHIDRNKHLSGSPFNDDDDDDAESCSCDVSDYYSCVTDHNHLLNGFEGQEGGSVYVNNGKEEDEAQKITEERWGNHHDNGVIGLSVNHQKSCVSVESINESMNEMEKNRLFWEACLAS